VCFVQHVKIVVVVKQIKERFGVEFFKQFTLVMNALGLKINFVVVIVVVEKKEKKAR
jgi:hypothetical protein